MLTLVARLPKDDFGERLLTDYIFMAEECVATHCHLPSGIFTQVSVKRSCESIGFPEESVPLNLPPPMAMAVSPNTVTCTFS